MEKEKDYEIIEANKVSDKSSEVQEDSEKEQENSEEESELEEKIEDTDTSIDSHQFHDFLKTSAENFSPVLEKAVGVPQQNLESDFVSISSSGKKQDDEQTGYSLKDVKENYSLVQEELRRIKENSFVEQPEPINIESVRMETVGRDLHPQLRNISPVNLEPHELRKHEIYQEGNIQPEKIDMERVGREPSERPIEKIKEYKIK